MTAHRIRLLGDPCLRAKSTEVGDHRSPALRVVVDDLRDTLRDHRTRHGMGRGLAAPQIGAPIRVVYIETGRRWILLNPEIVDVGNEDFWVWDDCFAFPELMVRVQRAYYIKVRYQDMKGKTQTVELEGDAAELMQHEIDHLDGVLAVDRPVGLDPFCLREEWNKHYVRRGRYGKPMPRAVPVAV